MGHPGEREAHCLLRMTLAAAFVTFLTYTLAASWHKPQGQHWGQQQPHAVQAAAAAQLPSTKQAVAMFAFVARDEAAVLPHMLRNVQRLAAKFSKVYVLMVENGSTDNTVGVFKAWLQQAATALPTPIQGEARSFRCVSYDDLLSKLA
jgi:hypothetical protein